MNLIKCLFIRHMFEILKSAFCITVFFLYVPSSRYFIELLSVFGCLSPWPFSVLVSIPTIANLKSNVSYLNVLLKLSTKWECITNLTRQHKHIMYTIAHSPSQFEAKENYCS